MATHFFKFFLIIPFFALSNAKAQDSIIFLNGNTKKVAKVIKVENKEITFIPLNKKKERSISINKVFSVNSGGKENVIYRQDSVIEYFMTIEQMRMFIKGEQTAIEKYKSPLSFIVGFGFGASGGLVIPTFATLAFIPPAVGTFAVYLPTPDVKEAQVSEELLKNPEFVNGYQSKVRTKRLKKYFYGSSAGFGSVLLFLLINGSLK